MPDSVSTENKEAKKGLKDSAHVSRRQLLVIWTALAAALGSQGIPAIVSMLENKPDVEDVQSMIAQQTAQVTLQLNTAVEAIKELHVDIKALQSKDDLALEMKGKLDALCDTVNQCCVRVNRVRRPKVTGGSKHPSAGAKPTVMDHVVPDAMRAMMDGVKLTAPEKKKTPFDQLEKVPEFDPKNMMQRQQLQVQVQETPK